jgi:Flp pilus assembly protein TadG
MKTRTERREAGTATVFVVGMALVLFICAGLVIDGGLAINARMRAADDAEQASRLAADSIDVDLLRSTGEIVIDADLARQRASGYLQSRGYAPGNYRVEPDPDTGAVRVRVRNTTNSLILSLVSIPTFTVNAAATSTPETGP